MAPATSERELLARMRNFEDHVVERKTSNDTKDILKTLVAFANSTPLDQYSVLYIGVRDSGEIETPQPNLDRLQRRVSQEVAEVYPPMSYTQMVIAENGKQALAVVVPHSKSRPHFSGPAYIRDGSMTLPASAQQFTELIARHNSVTDRILAYKGKWVTVLNSPRGNPRMGESQWPGNTTVVDCDQFYVTLMIGNDHSGKQTFPINRLDLGFDFQLNRLVIKIDRY
jgi:Putative DNA-binding domain